MIAVNELQRLSFLDAMGVASYVSRGQLAGAAPTRRLRLKVAPQRALVAAESPAKSPVVEPLRNVRAGLAPVSDRADSRPAEVVEAPRVQVAADVPVFSLAATLVGGRLWLEEIPRSREPGGDYRQLLASICQAMGWPVDNPVIDVFNWPFNNSAQLDHGEEAARFGVSGFLHARLDRKQPRGIILLGGLDSSWFNRDILGDRPVVELPPAWRMLRDPTLKRRAWQALKPLLSTFA